MSRRNNKRKQKQGERTAPQKAEGGNAPSYAGATGYQPPRGDDDYSRAFAMALLKHKLEVANRDPSCPYQDSYLSKKNPVVKCNACGAQPKWYGDSMWFVWDEREEGRDYVEREIKDVGWFNSNDHLQDYCACRQGDCSRILATRLNQAKKGGAPSNTESQAPTRADLTTTGGRKRDGETTQTIPDYVCPKGSDTEDDVAFGQAMAKKADAANLAEGGDFAGAIKLMTEALSAKPSSAMWWAFRADLYLKNKQWDHAAADASQALERNPDSARALRVRGMAHMQKGEWELAVKDLSASQIIDFNESVVSALKEGELKLREAREEEVMNEREEEAKAKARESSSNAPTSEEEQEGEESGWDPKKESEESYMDRARQKVLLVWLDATIRNTIDPEKRELVTQLREQMATAPTMKQRFRIHNVVHNLMEGRNPQHPFGVSDLFQPGKWD